MLGKLAFSDDLLEEFYTLTLYKNLNIVLYFNELLPFLEVCHREVSLSSSEQSSGYKFWILEVTSVRDTSGLLVIFRQQLTTLLFNDSLRTLFPLIFERKRLVFYRTGSFYISYIIFSNASIYWKKERDCSETFYRKEKRIPV